MSHSGPIYPEPRIISSKTIPLTTLQQQLVQDNLGLAFTEINKYYYHKFNNNLTKDEITSAAYLGLIFGVQHYEDNLNDPEDNRWCEYIIRCIDGYILDEMNSQRLVHIPRNRHENKSYKHPGYKLRNDIKQIRIKATITSLIDIVENVENEDINIKQYFHLLTPDQKQVILFHLAGMPRKNIHKFMNIKYNKCGYIYRKALSILKDAIMKDL